MRTRAYISWMNMRGRCKNPNHPDYTLYGGRGIQVCSRWDDFKKFFADMGERPEGFTLGRIDNSKDYSPENCWWETPLEQANNRRRHSFQSNNSSGVIGVTYDKKLSVWIAKGNRKYLFQGRDFFLACCARKSWEAQNAD